MNRQQKKSALEKLRPRFENVHFYIVDAKGMGAEQVYRFRVMMLEQKVTCQVIPNTLLSMLFRDTPYESLQPILKQGSMVCFSKENPGAPAKVIKKFRQVEKIPGPIFKGGWVAEQTFLGEENFQRLVNLKSKEELLAEIIGLLQSPSRRLLGAIQASQQKLLHVLEAIKKQ